MKNLKIIIFNWPSRILSVKPNIKAQRAQQTMLHFVLFSSLDCTLFFSLLFFALLFLNPHRNQASSSLNTINVVCCLNFSSYFSGFFNNCFSFILYHTQFNSEFKHTIKVRIFHSLSIICFLHYFFFCLCFCSIICSA